MQENQDKLIDGHKAVKKSNDDSNIHWREDLTSAGNWFANVNKNINTLEHSEKIWDGAFARSGRRCKESNTSRRMPEQYIQMQIELGQRPGNSDNKRLIGCSPTAIKPAQTESASIIVFVHKKAALFASASIIGS